MNRHFLFVLLQVLTPFSLVRAEWEPVLTDLLKAEKTGYGGLCGIVVDHDTGEVFVNLSDLGMFRSRDQGQTWKRVTEVPLKGRTETPGCWSLDPTGNTKTMVSSLVYGAPISVSTDSAVSFRPLDARSEHSDWCAVDWKDPANSLVLALKHEQGGLLIASNDGGNSFRDLGPGYISGWVFGKETAVVAKESGEGAELLRTTDGGASFSPCGRFTPVGHASARALPKWKDGHLYWLTREGLIASGDEGESWKTIAEIKDALYGPVFGASAKHLLVLTRQGIIESSDAGQTWSDPIPAPTDFGDLAGLTWLEYDPQGGALYLMKMSSDLYRFERPPLP